MRALLLDERGATAAEYAIILAVIGSIIALAALTLAQAISGALAEATTEIETCGGGC